MEFIVENQNLPDMNTRMVYLRKTIENNPKACRLIQNQCEITDAIEILKQHFGIWNGMEQEKYVQKLIKEYYFIKNEKDDEKNFRKLFLISLHIVYTVHGDLKKKYLNVIIRKLPQSFYCQSPYFFLLMIRAKLRIYDCPFVLKPGTYEELEQLADRLIDDRTICPICFKYQKHIRCHRIVKCRFLEMIIRRYGGNQRNLLVAMANQSASDQNSIDQNTTEQSINNENYDDEATIDQKSSESERYSTEQNDNDEQHLECKVEESPKNKSNNIPDLFTQQSSEIETSKSPDQENIKIIPITLICSKRGPINRIKAFINDPDGRNNDAMIEFGYLKSLNIDAKIDYETVSDLRTIIHIVGYVEIKIAIGFLIRTIKFAVFSSLNEEQTVRISTDILKQFSLISPPTRFEQRFAQIINCSIDGKNDVDEPKRETLRKFFDANFLINSAIKFDTNESLKISFNINDYNFDNEYFINYDNQIYYDLDVAIEDRSLTELKFQKAHIYLLKGDETDTDDDHNMDSI
ncbi:hypothetical protein BLA29_004144 [Euroglyphus maynei]|uniref:Uncharacterized protein n=1 Tax=Euroglyphus maynei TaxID=6958 RepID=A0A1Y3BB26_EURMA|nr:hypothetical protein BLA29_004144 [Euroglyphus maynei]